MKDLIWLIALATGAWLLFGEHDRSNLSTPSARAPSSPPAGMPAEIRIHHSAPVYSAPTFAGYPCTSDCSGHEAGYEWAEDNGIEDPDDCDGNSESFIEGCRTYAEEQQSIRDDEEGEDEDEGGAEEE